jgi:hypothetical protein
MMRNSIRFVPIEKWPGEWPKTVERSPFSSPHAKTLALLDRELTMIGAREIVLQAFFSASKIKSDGWPYADARPSQTGVILSFRTHSKGMLSFPCWRYNKYEDNLRAIALSLEALRAVDRYGVTQRAEQYQGWKQIEGPKPAFPSAEEAARFIAVQAYGPTGERYMDLLGSPDVRAKAYRAAAARLHPEAPTGNAEQFLLLQKAREMLDGKRVMEPIE